MATLPPIAINGKFLAAAPTGVHRVAAEFIHALASDGAAGHDIQLWVPRDAEAAARSFSLPVRVITPFTHRAWEQLSVPFRDHRRLLLNLCNIGPVLRTNAITMIHDVQVHSTPESYSRLFRLWYKGIQPLLAKGNHRILTVSGYSRDEIARTGLCPAERISVIHNGVDHILRVRAEPGVTERLGLVRGRFVVALASTLAHKNIALLAKAFSLGALGDIQLVLVGDHGRAAFAAQGITLPPSTIFTGRISDGELRALYEAALCLAFPSRTEGFGLPPLEAMLVGCPAVVAPCGALPEVCGDAALYAGPDDAEEWVKRILALADDGSVRTHFVGKGLDQARKFTWRAAALSLLDVVANTQSRHSGREACATEMRAEA
jgi:glycosyltransferase involved in cell wall biosynthesis